MLLAGGPPLGARPSQKSALVSVVADGGKPLRELTAKDFIVKEDGAKREVLDAQISDEPLSVVFLIDTTQPPMSAVPPTQDLRASAATFVKAVLAVNPDAQIAMGEFAGAAVITQDFTNKSADLEKVAAKLYPNQAAIAVLLEGLVDAGKKLATKPAPRRAIVTIDFNSPEGSADRTMKDAVSSVHDAGATLLGRLGSRHHTDHAQSRGRAQQAHQGERRDALLVGRLVRPRRDHEERRRHAHLAVHRHLRASRRGVTEGDDLRDGGRFESPADAIHAVMRSRAPATSSAARRGA